MADYELMKKQLEALISDTEWEISVMANASALIWDGLEDIASQWQVDRVFEPSADQDSVSRHKALWKDAVKRALSGK